MTLRRTALWCAAGLAILLGVAALTVALAVYRPALVRPWAQRALTPRGGTASLASLKISLTPPTIVLSGLVIAGPPRDGDLMRLDHLQFELIPGRFFHGGPWLRHLEARGVVFERPRPRETEGPPDLTPLTRLFDIEDLSLTDARLRVAMPQGVLAVDRLRLRLTPGEGGMRAFAGSGDLSFRGKGSPASAAKLSARGTVTPELALSVDLESASGHLELPWISGDLSGRTRLRMTRKNFQVEDLVPDAAAGAGEPGSAPDDPPGTGPPERSGGCDARWTGPSPGGARIGHRRTARCAGTTGRPDPRKDVRDPGRRDHATGTGEDLLGSPPARTSCRHGTDGQTPLAPVPVHRIHGPSPDPRSSPRGPGAFLDKRRAGWPLRGIPQSGGVPRRMASRQGPPERSAPGNGAFRPAAARGAPLSLRRTICRCDGRSHSAGVGPLGGAGRGSLRRPSPAPGNGGDPRIREAGRRFVSRGRRGDPLRIPSVA